MNQFLFGIYPYISLAVFLVGSLLRFARAQYTWRSGSSQLLRARQLRLGSNLFHAGVLFLLFGHFFGMLTPHWAYEPFIGAGAKQLMAMITGGIAGVLAIVGLPVLLPRRRAAPIIVASPGAASIAVNNLPAHTHAATFTPGAAANVSVAVPADSIGSGTDSVPGDNKVLGAGQAGAVAAKLYSTDAANTTLKPFDVSVPAATGTVEVQSTGNGQPLPVAVRLTGAPVNTVPPFNTLNFIIAVQGVYPSRP